MYVETSFDVASQIYEMFFDADVVNVLKHEKRFGRGAGYVSFQRCNLAKGSKKRCKADRKTPSP